MKKILSSALVVVLGLASPAFAKGAPPTGEQKAAFLAQCLAVAPDARELCSCKADAAMTLIDGEFMAVVIAAMQGKDPGEKYYDAYNDYIARSTQACGMGM